MKDVLAEDFEQISKRNIPWNELKNKTFLITGATGLIGSLLTKFLLYANQAIGLNATVRAVVRNVEKADKIFAESKTEALSYVVADLEKEKILIMIN